VKFLTACGVATLTEEIIQPSWSFSMPSHTTHKPGLTRLLSALQKSLHTERANAREAIDHPGTKGTESEDAWVSMLNEYLPRRYVATRAAVIDSHDNQSDQIDVVIHDRQYTP